MGRLQVNKHVNTQSPSNCMGEDKMEIHCSECWLPEHEDTVIVVRTTRN